MPQVGVSVSVLLVPDGPLEHDETSGGRPFHLKINKLKVGESVRILRMAKLYYYDDAIFVTEG
jgi:hypothetical protein